MNKLNLALLVTNIALIGLLPRIFFKRDGRYNLSWFATAAPFGVSFLVILATELGRLRPMSIAPAQDFVSLFLAMASIALIAFTLGTHRRPLALWHQNNDAPVEIVTWGAYSVIRHPFYSSFLLTLVGMLVAIPHPLTIAMLVYGLTVISWTARREERRLLTSTLATTYQSYMATTGRFVPGLGRLRS
jgi:protein-S-isoprenylcysteine O-methyltransferase Ste14